MLSKLELEGTTMPDEKVNISQEKLNKKGSDAARARLESLFSSQAGPLPIDLDEPTSAETQSSESEQNSPSFAESMAERIVRLNPRLTVDKVESMLRET